MKLQASNVSRSFGGVHAVQQVSISAQAGDIVGLIGPNGSGKSTLLNLLDGTLRLDAGTVELDGAAISTLSPMRIARRGVVRTHQQCRVFGELTVEENVALGLSATTPNTVSRFGTRSGSKIRRYVHEILRDFGLYEMRNRECDELSYGRRRAVEIARAVAGRPKLLLLDEPVAGMNEAEVQEFAEMFRGLKEQGMGLLLIEHHVDFVMDLCSVVTVLNTGQTIAFGTPAEVRASDAVKAAYLGVS